MIKDIIVRAGAGAGKTYTLTHHVMDYVKNFKSEHKRLPQMVVTTFTVKATQELKERLMLLATEMKDYELLNYVSSPHKLHISTIHGVLSKFLKQFGYEIGLDNSFEVLSNVELHYLAKKKLKDIVFQEQFTELSQVLNIQKLMDLCLSYYEAKQEHQEIIPLDIKSFEWEIKESIKSWQKDFKSVLESINWGIENNDASKKTVQNWMDYANVVKSLININCENSWNQIYLEIQSLVQKVSRLPSNTKGIIVLEDDMSQRNKDCWAQFKSVVSDEIYNSSFWADLCTAYKSFHELAEEFYTNFHEEKLKQGKISMADMELLSYELLQTAPHLATHFSASWDYWMIDEFQDTSPFQLNILKSLIADRSSFLVGDPQQSIYLFRGADKNLFELEENRILSIGGEREFKLKNYRSKPSTLMFINDFTEKFGFSRMEAKTSEFLSESIVANFDIAEEQDQENLAISSKIVELLESGVSPDSICILARTNKSLSEISRKLKELNVPYFQHASGAFFARREVQDAVALLKFIVNPKDNKNLIQLLRTPWFKVSDNTLSKVVSYGQTYWDGLINSVFELKEFEQESISYLMQLQNLKYELGLVSTLERAIVEKSYFDYSYFLDNSGKREANLWKLIFQLKEAERDKNFNPIEYINTNIDALERSSEGEGEAVAALEPNRVQLMSIHASKGLQFEHLFLIHMGQKPRTNKTIEFFVNSEKQFSFPLAVGNEDKRLMNLSAKNYLNEFQNKELEEHDRLLYVALTRAKECIYMSWSLKKLENYSWAKRIQWNLSEGVHKTEYYSYRVQKNNWEEKLHALSEKDKIPLRDKFQELDWESINIEQKSSVSRILEERSEFGRSLKKSKSQNKDDISKLMHRVYSSLNGILVHKILESKAYNNELDLEELCSDFTEDQWKDVLSAADFCMETDEMPLSEIIREGIPEWGFILKTPKGIIEGQIDLWAELENEIWVLDYKTGSEKYKDKAFEQLEIYAMAIHKLNKNKKIMLSVVYPFSKMIYQKEALSLKQLEEKFFEV